MLNKLDEREKLAVISFIAVLILLTVSVIFKYLYEMRSELSNRVIESRASFPVLERAIKDYNYFRSLKSGDDESSAVILQKVDQLIVKYAMKDQLQKISEGNVPILKQYNKYTIELTFRSVVLQDMMKMIYDVEMNKQVNCKVDYLSFRKSIQGKELYDVNIKFAYYSRIGKK